MAFRLYNGRFILLVSASFITIFSSIAIYFSLPLLLSHVIRQQISLSPNSGSLKGWRLNDVVDRFYLYNLTNMNELIAYSEENQSNNNLSPQNRPVPHLGQVGPFAFKQNREKLNILFDSRNETVRYDQKKVWFYVPDLNKYDDIKQLSNLTIAHLNTPLAGATYQDVALAEVINTVFTDNNLKVFMTHNLNEMLFEGYYDVLMEQGKMMGNVAWDRFGWFYGQNQSLIKNIRIFTGPSNETLEKFGGVDEWQFDRRFDAWTTVDSNGTATKDNICNQFRLSSGGEFFPPPANSILYHVGNQLNFNGNQNNQQGMNQMVINNQPTKMQTASKIISNSGKKLDDQTISSDNRITINRDEHSDIIKSISLFMPDFCRTFEFYYNHTYEYKGLSVNRFVANEFTFNYDEIVANQTINSNITDNNSNKLLKIIASHPKLLASPRNNFKIVNGKVSNPNNCYCTYNEKTNSNPCPPNGIFELASCIKGSNIVISFPHFLYSQNDPKLTPYLSLFKDPIEPNDKEHSMYLDLDTSMNIIINAQINLQINSRMKYDSLFNFTIPYGFLLDPINNNSGSKRNTRSSKRMDELILPQIWIQSRASIDDYNLSHIKFLQQNLKWVTPIVTIVLFGFGSILLAASAKMAFDLTYGNKSRKGSQSGGWTTCPDNDQSHNSMPECEIMLADQEMCDLRQSK